MRVPIIFAASLAATAAQASSLAAIAGLDRATARACRSVSGLNGAKVENAVRFSDTFAIDARIVRGTWPQPHMRSAKATMLCLYDRRAHRAEAQELPGAK